MLWNTFDISCDRFISIYVQTFANDDSMHRSQFVSHRPWMTVIPQKINDGDPLGVSGGLAGLQACNTATDAEFSD
jgi:hypothetical protein